MAKRIDPSLIPSRPTLDFEQRLWTQGLANLAGVDEAGRGALAGPVYAAAVVLPNDSGVKSRLAAVRDSKQMSEKQRAHWAIEIRAVSSSWSVGKTSSSSIDRYGIIPATRLAMMKALDNLALAAEHVLIDALILPDCPIPQTSLIKGDMRSLSIASASVLAKVARDEELRSLDQAFPSYGFGRHKGYATEAHRRKLAALGPIREHRRSFAPLRQQ